MVEVWPVVRVVGIGEFNTSVDFLKSYCFDSIPPVNASLIAESLYGYPDPTKAATLSIYAHPQDNIILKAPGFNPARLDNSLMYVSSGGSVRNTYFINAWKIPHTPVFPTGAGQIIMVWRTPKTNAFLARNIETLRAHPFFRVQDETTFSTSSKTPVEIIRWDFESVKYRDVLAYVGFWSSISVETYIIFEVSKDGTTWTAISNILANNYSSEKFAYAIASNVEFRYLRAVIWVYGGTGYYRIRKLYVFE